MEEGPRGSQDLHRSGSDTRRTVSVIGAGPAALLLAAHLDPDLFEVTLFEQNTAAGRKFLVAGDGGLNLTHSEDPAKFITRYTPPGFLSRPFLFFNNLDLVRWLQETGLPTF